MGIHHDSLYEIDSLDALQPGDILIFLPWQKNVPFINRLIMFLQSLFYGTEGYYTLTHSAVYMGKTPSQEHAIAHVAEKGYQFGIDTLEKIEKEDKEKRPFIVFRPSLPGMAQKITEIVTSLSQEIESKHLTIKWSLKSALRTLFKRAALSPQRLPGERKISTETHCSRFIMQCIKMANQSLKQAPLDVRSTISPACLFKTLNENANFQRLHYTADINTYEILKDYHLENLARLRNRAGDAAQAKYHKCCERFSILVQELDQDIHYNNLTKAKTLHAQMQVVLSENTGLKLQKETKSTKVLNEAARKLGIFNHNLSSKTVSSEASTAPEREIATL